MKSALVVLLASLAGASPARPSTPAVRAEGAPPGPAPQRLQGAEDVKRLCRALEPVERVRAPGDAVDQGEAAHAHDLARDRAIEARYEVVVPAAKLALAPYDAVERTLSVKEPAVLAIAGGVVRLWPTEARGLAVEVDAAAARRVLQAQRQGALELVLVFDLPDDATCGATPRGDRFSLGVDPVAWRWVDRGTVLARGGAGADRPLLGTDEGAWRVIHVGDAIAGGEEAKRAVLAHADELDGCYVEALRREPTLDGVLVADLAGPTPEIAADSVNDAGLAACVRQALRGAAGTKAVVPIRFALQSPEAGRN